MRTRLWALAAVALLLGACHASPPPPPKAADDDARLAAEALGAGDYARAAVLYRRAVTRAPDSVPLRYGLGVAASYLDLRAEAIRELTWVVSHGVPASPEVESARQWLVKVGAMAPPQRAAAAEPGAATGSEAPPAPGTGRVEGRAVSIDVAQPGPLSRQTLFLIEQPSRVNYFRLRTDEAGRFRFAAVPPGMYKLSDRITGSPLWRLRVEVKAGQNVFIDLGPGNARRVRDDFPDQP
jgi:hypothetical protein